MKKSLTKIVLLIGAFALNLSMLCQAHCVGNHKEKPAHMAANAELERVIGFCTMHPMDDSDKAKPESDRKAGSSIKCGCSADIFAINLDFNLNFSVVDLTPHEHVVLIITPVNSIFTSVESVPLEEPPKVLA